MTEALQQEIRTLRSLHNSERDPEGRVFAPLADAYRRAGEIPEAVRLLNDGLTRLPDFVPGHVVAAQLYVEQGLAEEAGFAARRALELDPDNVNALRYLLRVLEQKGDAGEAAEVRGHLVALEPDFVDDGPASDPARDLGDLSLDDAEPALAASGSAADEDAPALGLDTLEPEAEPVFDLDALSGSAADEGDEQVSDIGLLSPDALEPAAIDAGALPEEEPVFDLGVVAPDEPEEPVLDMAALAPDEPEEPVLDMAALAPDEPEEPALDMAALAPDEPEEPVLDMAALAPDEPEEPALDMAALAPDEL
ncbi:MAG TPA: hypothetical protein VMM35_07430, partial [Longimicrobiales bacterium]|nr:hypothetical protein [Longimicrobiales bacterium]